MSNISYVVPATIVDVIFVASSSTLAACLLRQLLLYALSLVKRGGAQQTAVERSVLMICIIY